MSTSMDNCSRIEPFRICLVSLDGTKTDPFFLYEDLKSFDCAIEDSLGHSYFWQNRLVEPQLKVKNDWNMITLVFKFGSPRAMTDEFVIYPMKGDSSEVLIDDLQISFLRNKRINNKSSKKSRINLL